MLSIKSRANHANCSTRSRVQGVNLLTQYRRFRVGQFLRYLVSVCTITLGVDNGIRTRDTSSHSRSVDASTLPTMTSLSGWRLIVKTQKMKTSNAMIASTTRISHNALYISHPLRLTPMSLSHRCLDVKRPRQESNPHPKIRSHVSCPLDHEGIDGWPRSVNPKKYH